jgi:hypothetical protein
MAVFSSGDLSTLFVLNKFCKEKGIVVKNDELEKYLLKHKRENDFSGKINRDLVYKICDYSYDIDVVNLLITNKKMHSMEKYVWDMFNLQGIPNYFNNGKKNYVYGKYFLYMINDDYFTYYLKKIAVYEKQIVKLEKENQIVRNAKNPLLQDKLRLKTNTMEILIYKKKIDEENKDEYCEEYEREMNIKEEKIVEQLENYRWLFPNGYFCEMKELKKLD